MTRHAPIVVGTAGHVDHGKTALVRALTGIDTDRLAEEKRRGITIELGFAALSLGDVRVSVVDVPGHERLLRTMLAGATGFDLVLLVVAADEGIMPQTREHLDVCDLLGVRRAVVAVTKAELATTERIASVASEVRELLEGTSVESSAVVPVSSVTGQGLGELRAALDQAARGCRVQDASGPFRLPVDRVFSARGFGTIVTGTVAGGRVETGSLLTTHRGVTAKVRGLETHGGACSSLQTRHARRHQPGRCRPLRGRTRRHAVSRR